MDFYFSMIYYPRVILTFKCQILKGFYWHREHIKKFILKFPWLSVVLKKVRHFKYYEHENVNFQINQ